MILLMLDTPSPRFHCHSCSLRSGRGANTTVEVQQRQHAVVASIS